MLMGCDTVYVRFDCNLDRKIFEVDGNKVPCLFYDELYRDCVNNVLSITQIRGEGDNISDIPSVLNTLPEPAYRYLTNLLNTNSDITVFLYQPGEHNPCEFMIVYEPYAIARQLDIQEDSSEHQVEIPYSVVTEDGAREPIDFGFETRDKVERLDS